MGCKLSISIVHPEPHTVEDVIEKIETEDDKSPDIDIYAPDTDYKG
jgi:hypothetical protein